MTRLAHILRLVNIGVTGDLDIEGARYDISSYLKDRGFHLDSFLSDVIKFFVDAHIHHYRIAYREQFAESLNLNLANEQDRRQLWETVANECGVDRKTRGAWVSGKLDPGLDELILYFSKHMSGSQLPPIDGREMPVRTAIARTLTYIRVAPPRKSEKVLSDPGTTALIKNCWHMLRNHEHYVWRRNLNQDAIDQVYYNYFGVGLSVGTGDIGALKREMEANPKKDSPFFWPWAVFKFATMTPNKSTNKRKANPHEWIWDDLHPLHDTLWEAQRG